MENYKETGLFWLPADPEDRVVGELVFDVNDGVSLTLNRPADETWPEDVGLIVGTAGTKYVTLLDLYERSHVPRSLPYSIKPQVFHADRLLIGHAFDHQDDVKFTAAEVSYYGLAEWVNRSGVTQSMELSRDGDGAIVQLRYESPRTRSARFSDGIVSVRFCWEGPHIGTDEWKLTHFPSVHLQYDDALDYEGILRHIAYIQGFITLCTDRAVTPREVTFYNRDISVRMLDGSARGQQPIEYRASPITSPTFVAKSKPQYPLDLGYDAVGGIETIAAWIQTATEYAPAVNLMTSFRSEMNSFVENRFLNVAGATEAFHDLKHPGRTQVPEAEWNRLQERMLAAIPEEHREWVSEELPYINRPSLSKRLTLLGKEAKEITGNLSGNNGVKIKRWAGIIAAVRNELTHPRREHDAFPGGVLNWLTESVYQVLRVCLLKECIADNGVFERLAASQGPSELEAYVSASITEAREIIRDRRARRQNG